MILVILIIILIIIFIKNKKSDNFIDIKNETQENFIIFNDKMRKEIKVDKIKTLIDNDLDIFKTNDVKMLIPSKYIVKLYYDDTVVNILNDGEYKVKYNINSNILNKIVIVNIINMKDELVFVRNNENKIVFFTLPSQEINWNWIYYMYGYNDYYVNSPYDYYQYKYNHLRSKLHNNLPNKLHNNLHDNLSSNLHNINQMKNEHMKYKLYKSMNNNITHKNLLAKHRKY